MFRPLAFVAVRQQAHEAGHAQPFAFTRADELVEHDLRAVGEIAELRFPQGQRVGFGQRVAVFEPKHRVFRQHGVDDFVLRLTFADVVERVVPFFGVLIDQGRMALAECAARTVLTGQAHRVAFGQQGPKGQCLAGGPVKAFAGFEHLGFGFQQTADGFVQREAIGRVVSALPTSASVSGDRGFAALIFVLVVSRCDHLPSSQSALLGL